MSFRIKEYKDILTVGLDHRLAQLQGGIVFDSYDPAVEGDKILTSRVERFLQAETSRQTSNDAARGNLILS